jgi:hypothetical protein
MKDSRRKAEADSFKAEQERQRMEIVLGVKLLPKPSAAKAIERELQELDRESLESTYDKTLKKLGPSLRGQRARIARKGANKSTSPRIEPMGQGRRLWRRIWVAYAAETAVFCQRSANAGVVRPCTSLDVADPKLGQRAAQFGHGCPSLTLVDPAESCLKIMVSPVQVRVTPPRKTCKCGSFLVCGPARSPGFGRSANEMPTPGLTLAGRCWTSPSLRGAY